MDPFTLHRLGRIRQQEILDRAQLARLERRQRRAGTAPLTITIIRWAGSIAHRLRGTVHLPLQNPQIRKETPAETC